MPSTPNRRWPSASRCSAAAFAPPKSSMAIDGISGSSTSSATKGRLRRRVISTSGSPRATQSSTKPSTSALWMFQASRCWFCAETSATPAPRASQTREIAAISARA